MDRATERGRAPSIRWRLLLITVVPMIALFIALSLLHYQQQLSAINDALRHEIRATVQSHTRDLEAIQLLDQRQAIVEFTERLRALPKIVGLTFYDPDGQPVFRYRRILRGKNSASSHDPVLQHKTLAFTESVSNRNGVFGSVQITVLTEELELARRDAIQWTSITVLGFLLLSLLLAYVLQLIIARPIIELSRFVRTVARDESLHEDRIELADRAELGALAAGINHLLDAIGEREARLEKLSALEAASKARAELVVMMNHEMRTPLNIIKGYGELLMEDARSRDDPSALNDLETIDDSASRLLGLINDLLDLSRLEAGKMAIHREPVVVRELIDEVAKQALPLVTRNDNVLHTEIADDLGAVALDRSKVIHCLLNLLSNAAKFTSNGAITVSAGREEGDDGAGVLRLSVRDTGIGMDEEQIARIFQPYAQAEASTSKDFGGTGLGLTICHLYCEAMSGTITVDSAPGEGSTFIIKLPADSLGTSGVASTEAET